MKKGFSLVELALALGVLGLLVIMSSVSFMGMKPKYELRKAVWEIQTRMNCARYQAIFEGKKKRITFLPDGMEIASYDRERSCWQVQETGFLEGVSVRANNQPIFHPQGTVSNLASITVSNSWGEYKITLAITGRIKAVLL